MGDLTDAGERRYAETERPPDASDIRKKTWPHGMPALRLTRTPRRQRAVVASPAAGGGLHDRPTLLRLARLGAGLSLLVIAWLGTVVLLQLVQALLHSPGATRSLSHYVLAVLAALGACWVGVTTLACIFAGAFCLTLAITNRDDPTRRDQR